MEQMPRGGQVSSPTFHSSLAYRGCARSSVALPAGSPLLVEGERSMWPNHKRVINIVNPQAGLEYC